MSDERKLDFRELMEVIDKCKGPVVLVTKEGDKINLKSKLSQLIGVYKIIQNAEISVEDLIATELEDRTRITRYLLYREI